MLTVPLSLALLLQTPFPTGLVLPPARPGDRPLEITVPYNPDACTKADLGKLATRIEALSARLDAVADHAKGCICTPTATESKVRTPPTVYRLTDSNGQSWTHTDPAWLRTYVGRINAASGPGPRYGSPAAARYGSSCAGGQCPR